MTAPRAAAALLALAGAALLVTLPVGLARSGASAPVLVRVLGPGGQAATGSLIAGGRVLTVAHVLAGGRRAEIAGAGRAAVLRVDARRDLAVLRAPAAAAGARAGAPVTGARVLVLRGGRAVALRAVLRRRIMFVLSRAGAPPSARRAAIEILARVVPGDSGAPVLDGTGRRIGVVFARSEERPGIAYATDLSP
jgi:S1-C subfamily serine protease